MMHKLTYLHTSLKLGLRRVRLLALAKIVYLCGPLCTRLAHIDKTAEHIQHSLQSSQPTGHQVADV